MDVGKTAVLDSVPLGQIGRPQELLGMLDTELQCYHCVGDEDDEPVSAHDLLQRAALGRKLPRPIRSKLKFINFEGQPKIWPVREQPPES